MKNAAKTPADPTVSRPGPLHPEKRAPGKPDADHPAERPAARIAALILAAGRSSRMGRNKLVEPIGDVPMIARVVDTALASTARPVLVVTGHEPARIAAALAQMPVTTVHNPDYADGLSTSLRAGLTAMPADVDGAIVLLGDMPGIHAALIDRLMATFDAQDGREICVPTHLGRRGNPVLWGRRFFAEMRRLTGDAGARSLMQKYPDCLHEVAVDDSAILLDADTPEALAALHL